MNRRPFLEEKYSNGSDVIYYVVYKSSEGNGNDEVLQHQSAGMVETAHITLHPDGTVNFRIKRSKKHLEAAVKNELKDYRPHISSNVKKFIANVLDKIN